jgi:hypothetical protein
MDFTMIISVALAAAVIVIVLMLVAVVIFQRWQIGDKNAALARFIRENMELLDEINHHTK